MIPFPAKRHWPVLSREELVATPFTPGTSILRTQENGTLLYLRYISQFFPASLASVALVHGTVCADRAREEP